LLILFALALVACGGAGEPVASPVAGDEATASATEPTPLPAPTGPPAATTAAPTDAPTPTNAPSALCPEVPRPALLLSTGAGYDLHNPLTGERCPLTMLGEDLGPEFVAGDRLYFLQRDLEATTVMIARVGPDGVVEPIPATQAAGDVYYLMQFAVAPDESRLAWSHTEPAEGDNPMALVSTLWLGAADASNATPVFEDTFAGDNRIATPVRFSADGQTLFFTWQPMGLGGAWSAFNGRYDNLYRVPAAGGEPQKVFDCADQQLFLCLGDFRDDGALAYIDVNRTIHVNGPDGAELAAIATTDDYAGYPTFSPAGDLFYSTAIVPTDTTGIPFPSPGSVYRVTAPYIGEPQLVASAAGLLAQTIAHPFLDAEHLVVSYAEGEMWGSALLNTTTGEIARLEPWPNSNLATVWPAN
jgi:hypothetical protein